MTETLTPDEIEARDELFAQALMPGGMACPSSEIGWRLRAALEQAESMGARWARWALEDAAEGGLHRRGIKWLKVKIPVTVPVRDVATGEVRLATRSQFQAIKRKRDASSTTREYQQTLYVDMTADELEGLLKSTRAQIESLRINERVQAALLRLMRDAAEGSTIRQELDARGQSLEAYLADALAA